MMTKTDTSAPVQDDLFKVMLREAEKASGVKPRAKYLSSGH